MIMYRLKVTVVGGVGGEGRRRKKVAHGSERERAVGRGDESGGSGCDEVCATVPPQLLDIDLFVPVRARGQCDSPHTLGRRVNLRRPVPSINPTLGQTDPLPDPDPTQASYLDQFSALLSPDLYLQSLLDTSKTL